jgi:serine phosphatase RsbU (regulator of sigma subunit)
MSDFAYRGARYQMQPHELLCTVTDGVTEAQNRAGALYGSARVKVILPALGRGRTTMRVVVDGLRADVEAFAAGAEPADDLTILALRWRGPGGAG